MEWYFASANGEPAQNSNLLEHRHAVGQDHDHYPVLRRLLSKHDVLTQGKCAMDAQVWISLGQCTERPSSGVMIPAIGIL